VQTSHHASRARKTRLEEFAAALREHLYRAELICYSLLLVVGVMQIIIREHFPNLQPPWPIIGIALIVALFGILFVPPLLLVIRVWKRPESLKSETHS
jgi:hypothetical protein